MPVRVCGREVLVSAAKGGRGREGEERRTNGRLVRVVERVVPVPRGPPHPQSVSKCACRRGLELERKTHMKRVMRDVLPTLCSPRKTSLNLGCARRWLGQGPWWGEGERGNVDALLEGSVGKLGGLRGRGMRAGGSGGGGSNGGGGGGGSCSGGGGGSCVLRLSRGSCVCGCGLRVGGRRWVVVVGGGGGRAGRVGGGVVRGSGVVVGVV